VDLAAKSFKFVTQHALLIGALAIIVLYFSYANGPHEPYR